MSERTEDLQYKDLKFIQNSDYFSFGTDAVLLARFAVCKKGEKIVDFGTGTGIIPVLLAADTEADFFGIEIQRGPAELARRNVSINSLDERIRIIEGDVRDAAALLKKAGVNGYADVVICNPPYDKLGTGAVKESEFIRLARYEFSATFDVFAESAASILGTGGRFYMIHRAKRLAELIYILKEKKLEPKIIRFIQSEYNKAPNYVLIKCIKDGKEEVEIPAPLIIYGTNGEYTDEIKEMYHIV